MLQSLEAPERCGQIQGWEYGGSVFLDYLRIDKKLHELSSSEAEALEHELEMLYLGLKQLLGRVGQLSSDTPRKL